MPQSAWLPTCCYELHKQLAGELAALGDGDPLFGRQKEHDDAWTYFTLHGVD